MLPLKKKRGRPSSGGPKIIDKHYRFDSNDARIVKELTSIFNKSETEIVRLAIQEYYINHSDDI